MPRKGIQNDDMTPLIRWPLWATYAGLWAERVVRAFWPLWSIVFVTLAALMLGLQDEVPTEWVWGAGGVLGLGGLWAIVRAARMFRRPSREEALWRLDATLKGNPIQALRDSQAIGANDPASSAIWAAHQTRMRRGLAEAKPVQPDLRMSHADPFALRYVALLALSVALFFGSIVRVQSVTTLGADGAELAQGPAWEGWMSPPRYTGLPTVYLNDITSASLTAPEGASFALRMYGEVGALQIEEDISGLSKDDAARSATIQDFEIVQGGRLAISGPGGRAWQVAMVPDQAPKVSHDGEIETSYDGVTQIGFSAQDDHGVVAGVGRFSLAMDEVDRRYGRAIDPEPRPALEVQLPMPLSGNRTAFTDVLGGNFSQHPWANLPVRFELSVEDARGQIGRSEPQVITLPGRRFFDPMAAALVEQRQSLLWNRANAVMMSQTLRAISNHPEDVFRKEVNHLRLRRVLAKLELATTYGITDSQQNALAQSLWDLALALEEGDLDDARERLRRARERLEEAMKNGASDQEIAELMQELREATQDYLRQLGREQAQQQDPSEQQGDPQETMELSQDDIQRMMDRIQELMEEGRMDEAMEAMRQLQEMLDNMQVTEGQGGQSPGEQAMEGLSDTLRDQQDLSDEAFRDLQEQFNPGQGQRQQGQRQPGQQQGQNQQGQGPSEGRDPGQGQGDERGDGSEGIERSLADRQNALRQELERQRGQLPGQGTEAGERALQNLRGADRAMEGAEEALRDGDLAEAIDRQSEAMEALRDGLRSLGDALAEQRQQQSGQQGLADGAEGGEQRDPLGRNPGQSGRSTTDEGLLQGEDTYRRAEELLGEIRRRSGENDRPEEERNYLERLLDRF